MPRICQTVIIFFFIGMLLGTLVGKLFNSALLPELKSIYTETLSSIPSLDIPSDKIVLSSFYRNIKFVLLLFIFSMTDLWRYFFCIHRVFKRSFTFLQHFNLQICWNCKLHLLYNAAVSYFCAFIFIYYNETSQNKLL